MFHLQPDRACSASSPWSVTTKGKDTACVTHRFPCWMRSRALILHTSNCRCMLYYAPWSVGRCLKLNLFLMTVWASEVTPHILFLHTTNEKLLHWLQTIFIQYWLTLEDDSPQGLRSSPQNLTSSFISSNNLCYSEIQQTESVASPTLFLSKSDSPELPNDSPPS